MGKAGKDQRRNISIKLRTSNVVYHSSPDLPPVGDHPVRETRYHFMISGLRTHCAWFTRAHSCPMFT
jgi:hypothetical protein